MSASFRLTLDTQANVEARINGGKGFTEKPTVTFELTLDPDIVLVKIWGSVNPLDPMNAGIGTTEEEAEWLAASADWLLALTTNPGLKELHVRVQDDVGNEATAAASITLSGEGPPTPEPEPTHPSAIPASGGPEVVPEPTERRHLISIASVGKISSTVVIATTRTLGPAIIGAAPRSSSSVSSTRSDRSQVSTRVTTSIAATAPVPGSSLGSPASVATVGRRDGEDFVATLVDLGIL